ncbi:condensation domain-containing protein [Streptomyces europaeiscabiei]|uniref:condensation domain-containing protein n=1 Tax=Streptomyces europaeiscabiei TaxID=146819 RepID=UPI0029B8F16A|nr:condensation domain-containing protein [Streptomyces europaeiscabiei]MDX3696407.1 condensation domain-containing protein [Streptomyces europaeiscabiei]
MSIDQAINSSQALTSVERELLGIWQELLGVDDLGPEEDFFFRGGHSLLAIRSTIRLKERMGIEVPYPVVAARPTARALAAWIDENREEARGTAGGSGVPSRWDRRLPAPLSPAQEQIWILQQLHPDSSSYHFQALVDFDGDLSVDLLESALNAIMERHEVFRTSVRLAEDGSPVQLVHPYQPYTLPVTDLSELDGDARQDALDAFTAQLLATKFDLERPPLVRWHLFRLGADRHVLLHVEHHLIHDGWSFNLFLGELAENYRRVAEGRAPQNAAADVDFVDFAVWQRDRLDAGDRERQLAYWSKRFSTPPTPLDLPLDRPRPDVPSFKGKALRIPFDAELSAGLRSFARGQGVSLYLTLFSGWLAELNRLTGQRDLCVGSSLANRVLPETQRMIGMLVNNLPMRVSVDPERPITDVLRAARQTVVEAQEHPDVPFHQILAATQLRRDVSRNAFFQVSFGFHDAPLPSLALPSVRMTVTEGISNGSAKFDMNIVVVPRLEQSLGAAHGEHGESITLIWEYATDLFDTATVEQLAAAYQDFLRWIVQHPDTPLNEYAVSTTTAASESAESVEDVIGAIWADLLGRPAIGPEDDFFMLGGHSMLAIRTAARLGERLGLDISALEVLRHPTVRELAARIEELRAEASDSASADMEAAC